METEAKVYISRRQRGSGKPSYHLRWIDPATRKWKSRKIGTDGKRAEREAALLTRELDRGTFSDLRRISWQEFADEHIASLPGKRHAVEAKIALDEFGKLFGCDPRRVTFSMIESYVRSLEAKGNKLSTRNKKLRYLTTAFGRGIKRGCLAKNPMSGWRWVKEDQKPPRIITPEEEAALLDAAEKLYGHQMRTFIVTALSTGGRSGELLGLSWSNVDLETGRITFTETKGRRDRIIPIDDDPNLVNELRRLRVQTQQDVGPFTSLAGDPWGRWVRVRTLAGVKDVTIHDCRRTFCCRLIRAGTSLPTVQKLAGHSDIKTTLRYYNWVSDSDLCDGMRKLHKLQAAQTAG